MDIASLISAVSVGNLLGVGGLAAVVGGGVVTALAAASWYRIVPSTEAHYVITPKESFIISSDSEISKTGKTTYFKIPKTIPFIGREVTVVDLTIREIIVDHKTFEKKGARYGVRSSTKYRVTDVSQAARRFKDVYTLEKQLTEVIEASLNAVAVKYDVVDARSQKGNMETAVRAEMKEDLQAWGLTLENFQLVNFSDTKDSRIISDISKRREVSITATTRQMNATKDMDARVAEAESDETARKREIENERVIAEQKEVKKQAIAKQEQITVDEEYKVLKIKTIQQAKIDKEKAIVKAEEEKETELLESERKRLEGQGDRSLLEERAKGEAAGVREALYAQAEGKEKLQEALNKFTPEAIRAMTAEDIVEMEKAVGIATAEALKSADLQIFAGGTDGKDGFALAQLLSAASVGGAQNGDALRNRLARPQDIGMQALGLNTLVDEVIDETVDEPESETVDEVMKTARNHGMPSRAEIDRFGSIY